MAISSVHDNPQFISRSHVSQFTNFEIVQFTMMHAEVRDVSTILWVQIPPTSISDKPGGCTKADHPHQLILQMVQADKLVLSRRRLKGKHPFHQSNKDVLSSTRNPPRKEGPKKHCCGLFLSVLGCADEFVTNKLFIAHYPTVVARRNIVCVSWTELGFRSII